ncbi:MAG: biopolymer transporter ExbD [Pseudomonadota bacterium]|nr:biopolymer transporter ExbD [Pseudomonadota bacterium]
MSRDRPARRRFGETPTVMLTSMTDMFTLILMFLLHFVDPSMSPDGQVALPSSPAVDAPAVAITLTITPEQVLVGGIAVFSLADGAHIPAAVERDGKRLVQLSAALERARAAPGSPTPAASATPDDDAPLLRVECDKSVPYTVVADALYTAGQAGFGRFQLVVVSSAGGAPAEPQ